MVRTTGRMGRGSIHGPRLASICLSSVSTPPSFFRNHFRKIFLSGEGDQRFSLEARELGEIPSLNTLLDTGLFRVKILICNERLPLNFCVELVGVLQRVREIKLDSFPIQFGLRGVTGGLNRIGSRADTSTTLGSGGESGGGIEGAGRKI